MDRHRRPSYYGSQSSSVESIEKINALREGMERLRLHQKRLEVRLSDLVMVDTTVRYMVFSFSRLTPRMQGRRLKFSSTGDHGVDEPVSSTKATSPIHSHEDGVSI